MKTHWLFRNVYEMSGTDVFIDTNICIYLLNGDVAIADMLQGQNLFISIITEIELSSYQNYNSLDTETLNAFLQTVTIINIQEKIKIKTIETRKKTKIKLPDCIIAASALAYDLPLITADKGFKKVQNLDLILFESN